MSMFRSGLVAIALLTLLGPVRAADDGCEKFAWSLAGEPAAFAAPDKTTVAADETLTALPAGGLGISPAAGGPARGARGHSPAAGGAGLLRNAAGAQAANRAVAWRHGAIARAGKARHLPDHAVRRRLDRRDPERPLRPLSWQHWPQRLPGCPQERAARSRCEPGRAAGEWRGAGCDRHYDRSGAIGQDRIRFGRGDGPSRATGASGPSAASRGSFYFAWGCFRYFGSGPCGVRRRSCS